MTKKNFAPFYESELADERSRANPNLSGVRLTQREGRFPVREVVIENEVGARGMGRPCGRYITISFPPLFTLNDVEEKEAILLLQEYLLSLLPVQGGVLVVGLGNRHLTADAIGPRTIEALFASSAKRQLFCVAPGVSEQSGLESANHVTALVRHLKPSCVMIIDALAARSKERLGCTIQLTNTGITPGSGICKNKMGIIPKGLGVPVISIGVPTMMHLGGALLELMETEAESLPKDLYKKLSERHEYILPEGIEMAVENATYLISRAISSLPSCSIPSP